MTNGLPYPYQHRAMSDGGGGNEGGKIRDRQAG